MSKYAQITIVVQFGPNASLFHQKRPLSGKKHCFFEEFRSLHPQNFEFYPRWGAKTWSWVPPLLGWGPTITIYLNLTLICLYMPSLNIFICCNRSRQFAPAVPVSGRVGRSCIRALTSVRGLISREKQYYVCFANVNKPFFHKANFLLRLNLRFGTKTHFLGHLIKSTL